MDTRPLEYSALEPVSVPAPVDRVDYLVERARSKTVLDLGALDETAYELKADTGSWLHKRLASVASRVTGIDNSRHVPAEGLHLFPNSSIHLGDIYELAPVVERHGRPDLIVAGELIEHLPDTLTFLRNLRRDCGGTGADVIITTPNACSWHNVILGLARRESMHRDHLHVYSYKTLHTMFSRAGFSAWTMRPYHARFTEMIEGSTGPKRWSAMALEKTVNFLERRFPILSCGWICEVRL